MDRLHLRRRKINLNKRSKNNNLLYSTTKLKL
jgi:hypothetical protein